MSALAPNSDAVSDPPSSETKGPASALSAVRDTSAFHFHYRPGLFLATRYLRCHELPVRDTPLEFLPHLSRRMIRFALRVYPRFLDRADLTFPIIIAGRGWYQIALDGRHRISKAIWTGHPSLPTVRVPWIFAIELLLPPVFTGEWLFLFARKELRRSGHHVGPDDR